MRIKIPYMTTTPMQDLKLTLALTPLWWILGIYFIIYHFVVFMAMSKLMLVKNRRDRGIGVPTSCKWLMALLIIFLLSILLNSFENDLQRILSALNTFSLYAVGFFVIVIFYNCATYDDIVDFMKISLYLALLGGGLGLFFLGFWLLGYRKLDYTTLMGLLAPPLNDITYFKFLLKITLTDTDWFLNMVLPRIPVFTSIKTVSGGQMLVLIPLFMGYMAINRVKIYYRLLLLCIPLSVLALSLARTSIFAMIVVSGLILFGSTKLSRNKSIVAFIALFAIPIAFILKDFFTDFLRLFLEARPRSTAGRLELYKDAIDYTIGKNPVFGIGIKVKEGYTHVLGSHSIYMSFFIITGLLGVFSFVMFQIEMLFLILKRFYRSFDAHRKMCLYFGASFIGLSLWVFTDTLDASPHLIFLYSLVIGGLTSIEKISESRGK